MADVDALIAIANTIVRDGPTPEWRENAKLLVGALTAQRDRIAKLERVVEAARNAERVLTDRIEFDVPCWICEPGAYGDDCPARSPRDGCPMHARDRLTKSLAALAAASPQPKGEAPKGGE